MHTGPWAAALAAALLWAMPAHAVTITIVNGDNPSEGFNATTARAAVGGNPGTTLGAQRLYAFQHAADLWGARLGGDVEVAVLATFDNLGGTGTSATLGSASPTSVFRDFQGAPRAATWYPAALANQLAGIDLNDLTLPDSAEISAQFNSAVDNAIVLGSRSFYYGLDGNNGSDVDFLTVVLHEIAHGLGFLDLLDPTTGEKFFGYDDSFTVWLEDPQITPRKLSEMSDAQRKAALVDPGNLLWFGPTVKDGSRRITQGRRSDGRLQMYAPATYANGSSTGHYDTVLLPNELMEPFATGVVHDLGLTLDLFADLGWETFPDPRCCDDALDCTKDTCFNGECQHEADDDVCEDDDPCSDNQCSLATGCFELPTTEPCDDGLYCTVADTCLDLACVSAARMCSDGIECTADSCDENADACVFAPIDAECSNGQYCDGVEQCNAASGCQPGEPVECSNLDDACRAGTCDEDEDACVAEPDNEGENCQDGEFCTVGDQCVAGQCQGSARDCSSLDEACLAGTCDETQNECVAAPANESQPCDDGNPCTDGDVCTGGECAGTGACASCGDGNVDDGEDCDDGNTAFVAGQRCRADCLFVACGKPTNSPGIKPAASDALFTLRSAVGQASCDLHVCDADSSGSIAASDALRILRAAVGQDVPLNCAA